MSDYLVDDFANVMDGGLLRLFPFGRLVKNGRVREITKELASKFRLPHFKPPLKLGSHEDATPAGGFITGLEVHEDGLYGRVEFTDKGKRAVDDGDYRYHSPEVIWEGGSLEDPTTGDPIEGPLVMGLALLHTPHLGEATALYTVEPIEQTNEMEKETMGEEVITLSALEKVKEWFSAEKPEADPAPEPKGDQFHVEAEVFDALSTEVEELRAYKAERLEAEAKEARLAEVKEMFSTEEFGEAYQSLADDEAIEMLATMSEEVREWVIGKFKALSGQIDGSLEEELGADGEGEELSLHDHITAYMAEKGINYVQAFEGLRAEKPELFS